MLLWCLFVSQIEEEDAGEGTDQEDHVEPPVIEAELQLPEDLGDDGAVLQGHAHSDQQHRGHEVHALRAQHNKPGVAWDAWGQGQGSASTFQSINPTSGSFQL